MLCSMKESKKERMVLENDTSKMRKENRFNRADVRGNVGRNFRATSPSRFGRDEKYNEHNYGVCQV